MEAEEYSFSISPPTHTSHHHHPTTIIPHIFCGNNGTCSLSFDEISVGYNASFSFSEHNESPVPAISVFFPCRRHHCFFFLFFWSEIICPLLWDFHLYLRKRLSQNASKVVNSSKSDFRYYSLNMAAMKISNRDRMVKVHAIFFLMGWVRGYDDDSWKGGQIGSVDGWEQQWD